MIGAASDPDPDTAGWSAHAVLDWCVTEGRFCPTPVGFLEQLGERLNAAGAPVWRIRVGFRTLHPLVTAWAYVWQRGQPCREVGVGHDVLGSDKFIGSPIEYINNTGKEFRRRLDRLDPGRDHRLLFELRDMGGLDYFAMPLEFSDHTVNAFILTTDLDAGFTESDLGKFRRLAHYIAPVLEIESQRRIARALLDTYVGPRTGERVLSGAIRRGDGEEIEAALWFSDLRDFTPMSESLTSAELLETMNEYFEMVSAAVTERGGEVLRFIGDAMLIVFPIGAGSGPREACRAALDAARDAFVRIAATNQSRRRRQLPQIRFGVGLHEGKVIYGNVGAPDRLDFTVMGSAVNRTARLESLTKTTGCDILMSERFASRLECPTRSVGFFDLKGIEGQCEVFAPAHEALENGG